MPSRLSKRHSCCLAKTTERVRTSQSSWPAALRGLEGHPRGHRSPPRPSPRSPWTGVKIDARTGLLSPTCSVRFCDLPRVLWDGWGQVQLAVKGEEEFTPLLL